MVSAARTLLCALLLSLGSPAAAVAGRQGQTTTTAGAQGVSLRLGGPARSRSSSTAGSARTRPPRRTRVTVEDDSDVLATADRLAGPAAAELLATVTGISPPCPDAGCRSRVTTTTTTTTTTTSPMPPIHLRRRPSPHPPSTFSPSPSAALAFWKRVRIGLENIWNSLSRVFTEMQPTVSQKIQ
uniref:Chromosome 1 open reading frame 56 n=1 Tax=Chinchilla lanigera TaxID=34839 RepID=A0A8C2UIE8_CHILA